MSSEDVARMAYLAHGVTVFGQIGWRWVHIYLIFQGFVPDLATESAKSLSGTS